MKTLQLYIVESLENEQQIDEGLKDFIKKFALTTAIAASCLTSFSQQPTKLSNTEVGQTTIEMVQNVRQDYDVKKDDILTIEEISPNAQMARNVAMAKARAEISKNKNYRIADVKTMYNQQKKLYKVVVILVNSNTVTL
jgi:hypothetical protein